MVPDYWLADAFIVYLHTVGGEATRALFIPVWVTVLFLFILGYIVKMKRPTSGHRAIANKDRIDTFLT